MELTMFLHGSYPDQEDKPHRVEPPSDKTSSSINSWMQLESDVSTRISREDSSKYSRITMMMKMRMMMMIFYGGISTNCTGHQRLSNTIRWTTMRTMTMAVTRTEATEGSNRWTQPMEAKEEDGHDDRHG
jgi:hypothetical protein